MKPHWVCCMVKVLSHTQKTLISLCFIEFFYHLRYCAQHCSLNVFLPIILLHMTHKLIPAGIP